MAIGSRVREWECVMSYMFGPSLAYYWSAAWRGCSPRTKSGYDAAVDKTPVDRMR